MESRRTMHLPLTDEVMWRHIMQPIAVAIVPHAVRIRHHVIVKRGGRSVDESDQNTDRNWVFFFFSTTKRCVIVIELTARTIVEDERMYMNNSNRINRRPSSADNTVRFPPSKLSTDSTWVLCSTLIFVRSVERRNTCRLVSRKFARNPELEQAKSCFSATSPKYRQPCRLADD